MTVSTTLSRISFNEDGATTVFPVPFRFLADADLVVERIAAGVVTTLVLATDYTVSGADNPTGGSVTRTAVTNGAVLRIRRATPRRQSMVYTVGDDFPAESHERALDRQMLISQEADTAKAETDTRAFLVPPDEAGGLVPALAARIGKFFGWAADGSAVALSGTGNDAALRTDMATGIGSLLMGFLRALTGAIAQSVFSMFAMRPINFLEFVPAGLHTAIRNGTNATDLGTYWTAFRNALRDQALAGHAPCGVIPSGTILTSTSPNWAIRNLDLRTEGEVVIQYSGAGSAFVMDGTAVDAVLPRLSDSDHVTPIGVFNAFVGRMLVRGDAATNGVYIRKMHRLTCHTRCNSAVTNGFNISSCVNSYFEGCSVSYNEQALVTVPAVGLLLTGTSGDQSSYCVFRNCEEEGPAIGIKCDYALGNMFFGGGAEACATMGLQTTANSRNNRFYGCDFEQNNPAGTKLDASILGIGNEFFGGETQNLVVFATGAYGNKLHGGTHQQITFQTGTEQNAALGTSFNRQATGASILDQTSPKANIIRNVHDLGRDRSHNAMPFADYLVAGASPYLYEHLDINPAFITVSGATNTGILRTLDDGTTIIASDETGTMQTFLVQKHDKLTIYYTVAPVIARFST